MARIGRKGAVRMAPKIIPKRTAMHQLIKASRRLVKTPLMSQVRWGWAHRTDHLNS